MVIVTAIMVLYLGISLQGRKMSESQTGRQVRSPGCEVVRLEKCLKVRQVIKSGHQVVKLSSCQVARLSGCQVVRLLSCQDVKLDSLGLRAC